MLSTLGAAALGWAVLRLVAGGPRPRRTPAAPPSGASGRQPQPGRGERERNLHVPPEAAREKGRGREAETPTQIPSLGWKDILWRTYEEFGQDRIMSVAAGVTYYALLAIFPAIAALVSIYGLFADPATIQDHLNALSGVLPGGAMEVVGEQVKRIASAGGGKLGLSFIIGLAISLWSANAGMKAVFDALNIVYDEEEKRSFLWLNAQSLAFTLILLNSGPAVR
jgi:membrane protein